MIVLHIFSNSQASYQLSEMSEEMQWRTYTLSGVQLHDEPSGQFLNVFNLSFGKYSI